MSENVLDTPIYFHESLEKVAVDSVPLPADDTRAYHNPDFEKLLTINLPKRHKRDPRWHCLRDYMICSTPYNFLPARMKEPDTTQTVKNFIKECDADKCNKPKIE